MAAASVSLKQDLSLQATPDLFLMVVPAEGAQATPVIKVEPTKAEPQSPVRAPSQP